MLGILFSTVILCGLMHFTARHEAEYSFGRVAIISAVISLLSLLLTLGIGLWGVPLTLAALAYALHEYCYLRWPKAILVTFLYVVLNVGLNAALYQVMKG